jgi:hypothetical protein
LVADQHIDGAGLLELSCHGGNALHVGHVDADAVVVA